MKILHLQKYLYLRDGISRYVLEVSNLLEKRGCELSYFSMKNRKNIPSQWNQYFVNNISFSKVNYHLGLKLLFHMIYSLEARYKLYKLLNTYRPDIAHVHNIYHHISPSVLHELQSFNIPIVHTVGDYHLISPHHNNLYHNGRICEISKNHRYYNTILYKCIKNSYLASFAEALEKYIHYLFGFYINSVDYFIAPSNYLIKKLIDYNIPSEKLVYLPYFIDASKYTSVYQPGDYVLYFGRLSPEKGLPFLLEVMRKLKNIKLLILGTGEEEKNIITLIRSFSLKNVLLINRFIPDEELSGYIQKSCFTILPSVSPEVFGLSIIESFAHGKPVVASKIGAIPEVIDDGNTGLLFEPGNVDDCRKKILTLWNNPDLIKKMGYNAKKKVEEKYNPNLHYSRLMNVYDSAIKLHKR